MNEVDHEMWLLKKSASIARNTQKKKHKAISQSHDNLDATTWWHCSCSHATMLQQCCLFL
jgi:hypothetical protein